MPDPIVNQYLGHEIVGTEYIDKGSDVQITLGPGIYNGAQKSYTITLTQSGESYFDEVAIGDAVKLISHSYSPSALLTEIIVKDKISSPTSKQIVLDIPTGISINTNGSGGYFQLRRKFIIARGIVGVF